MNHAILFGASSAIATKLAERLTLSGDWTLSLVSRNQPASQGTWIQANATSADGATDAVAQATETNGPIHAVANCIGSIRLKPSHLLPEEEWDEVLRVNLSSCYHITKAVIPHMSKDGASICLVSSVAGQRGFANHEAIAAAKAGVEGFVRSAAATYAPRGIRVNAVAPGLTDTPAADFLLKSDAVRKASEAMHPLKTLGQPEDIASAIAWLLDPQQRWVTGQVLGVDGGIGTLHQR